MKRKKFFGFSSLSLAGIIVATELVTVSCSIANSENNVEENISIKEQNIVENFENNSKLSFEKREELKNKQTSDYKNLSLDLINKYLLDNANMSLHDYFVNLNNQNNLTSKDANYISPELGILLVEDILNGDILIQDIKDVVNDYKESNYEEYVKTLEDLNLTEEQVNDSENIDEIVSVDQEEKDIDNELEEIEKEEAENPEGEIELDELFQLNDKYNEGDVINVNFYKDGNFFFYNDYEQLETRYIDEYDLYFDIPLNVTIEMDDGSKIRVENFDISELELNYREYGFFGCQRETKLLYKDKVIYRYHRDWWKNAYRKVSKVYYTFNKLSNKIKDDDSKFVTRKDKDTYILSIDKSTYALLYNLENKIISLRNYQERSEKLNIASWSLTTVAWAVAAAWTATSFLSFGGTAGYAVAATLQASTLTITSYVTLSEINKTKSNLNRYIKLYESNEYDVLINLLNIYSDNNKLDFRSKLEITIKAYFDYFNLWKFSGEIVKISNLKFIKSFNVFLSKPKYITYTFDKLKIIIDTFKNRLTKGFFKFSEKVSKKIINKLPTVLAKEIEQKIICVSTAWANPTILVIDAFDLVITAIEICNDILHSIEEGMT